MSLNGIKFNNALRKNRDVHLFLHLVKAFNNQRVIFPLRKVWKTAEFHCAVFPRKHTYPVLHKKVYSNPPKQFSFSKEKQ